MSAGILIVTTLYRPTMSISASHSPSLISEDTKMSADHNNHMATRQLAANRIARKAGYGKATKIVHAGGEPRVISHTKYGYRKTTTGQYVPNSYRNHFGWKNTYYQAAETVVNI
jgi:hypothetical protein